MGATVTTAATKENTWGGGNEPLKVSYGKMMMWYFILSDSLTFCGFLVGYGFTRYKFMDTWPIADEVFNHFPFLHGVHAPMYYVALMTFILIFSSVTMVLAVDAGHQMKKGKVATYMFLTILGGLVFLGSQAWEWKNFITGTYGAVETRGGSILHFVKGEGEEAKQIALSDFAIVDANRDEATLTRGKGTWFLKGPSAPTYSIEEIKAGLLANPDIKIRTQKTLENAETGRRYKEVLTREQSVERINDATIVVEGANLIRNEYGHKTFGDFFFFITGFHGFHVFTGILINVVIFFNVLLGTYQRRGSYEMVEKGGLYWHFVDLVWVFVFTFFYLV
ncbi:MULTISPECIES: cytochrome c oxidase subunit 3 [Myroides]|uniref:Cytochrome oxidase subunit III n=1 Tax=Myroides albus TaxID=2562892 RepID=A0A6I3LLH4_9FLAO|nr:MULTISPECIES: cytochrome c oxidase subunit 3 [Myroides]MTG96835.1 cytochrome oxidase subunit III [Myroides albus]MVX36940.1 cytochrome oxidase subunit III [Myroides sp. LoEW2-1]UVD78415.1 cytochrome c oxidase subunit 3 [Myroides albus]